MVVLIYVQLINAVFLTYLEQFSLFLNYSYPIWRNHSFESDLFSDAVCSYLNRSLLLWIGFSLYKTLGYFRMLRIKSMLDEVDIYLKTKVNRVSNNEEGVYWVQHLNVKQKTQMTV